MTIAAILSPVFVQVALIFVLLVWMGRSRGAAIRSGQVRIQDVALGERNWPASAMQAGNAYHNQFEMPVLFLVLVAFAIITRKADLTFVVMSWVFVVLRLVHAFIIVTSNRVRIRFTVFLIGALVLLAMWIIFALRIFAADLAV